MYKDDIECIVRNYAFLYELSKLCVYRLATGKVRNLYSLNICYIFSIRYTGIPVAPGWTGVDMSTPLLPEVISEIDANAMISWGNCGKNRMGLGISGSVRLYVCQSNC